MGVDPINTIGGKVKEEEKSKYTATEVRSYEENLDKKTEKEILILILRELRKLK